MLYKQEETLRLDYIMQNIYNFVAHNFSSLTDQALNIPFPEIICCLKAIQKMKFYLRTCFCESKG